MQYEACICVACQQRIEFPAELAGQTINCPTCSQALILPNVSEPAVIEQRKGLFGGLVTLFDEIKQRRSELERDRSCLTAFASKLDQVLADGELEPHEVRQLIDALEFYANSGFRLSQKDAEDLYLKILRGIHWRKDTEALTKSLHRAFGLSTYTQAMQLAIIRGRERVRVENGQFTPIQVPGLILKAGETAFWLEPASLIEDRVIRRRYEGGSQGVSFRVMKGVSFRVGAHRGQSVSDVAPVAVSVGNLILTNQRFYFAGDKKNFNIRLTELAQVQFGWNTLTLFSERREKARVVQFFDPDRCELFKSVLTGVSHRLAAVEGNSNEVEQFQEDEEVFRSCVEVIREERKASVSLLQRRLRLGYGRAARIMDELERRGVVGPSNGAEPRQILVDL